MPAIVSTKAEQQVNLSTESSSNMNSLVSDDFAQNMANNWDTVKEQLGQLGLTDPDGMKQLLTMRNLTKDLSLGEADATQATATAIKVFEDRIALDLKAAGIPNDKYLDTTMAAVDLLHKAKLLDDPFVTQLTGQVLQAMDFSMPGASEVIDKNMDYRKTINDTLEQIVTTHPSGIHATLEPMQKIQQLAASAESGEAFIMSVVELGQEGGITQQLCESFLTATPYFLAADEVPEGMDELRYFVGSF
jgi:hypothetical protein